VSEASLPFAAPPPVRPGAGAAPAFVKGGEVLSRTFRAWRQGLHAFVAVGVLQQAAVVALAWAFNSPFRLGAGVPLWTRTPEVVAWNASAASWLVLLGTSLFAILLRGAVAWGTLRHLAGRPVTVGDMLAALVVQGPTAILSGALAQAAITIGIVLLVVPGVMWALAFSLVMPVAMLEGRGVLANLERSSELTRGSRWQLLQAFLVVWLVSSGPGYLGLWPSSAAPLAVAVGSALAGAVLGPLLGVAEAVAYHALRRAKEGADAAELGEVFE